LRTAWNFVGKDKDKVATPPRREGSMVGVKAQLHSFQNTAPDEGDK